MVILMVVHVCQHDDMYMCAHGEMAVSSGFVCEPVGVSSEYVAPSWLKPQVGNLELILPQLFSRYALAEHGHRI
jgi:hypothetical protein